MVRLSESALSAPRHALDGSVNSNDCALFVEVAVTLEAESPLWCEFPVDGAPVIHHARDLPTKLLLQ
jgi:hypothetical protein